jgi:hypothetical protein
LSDLVDPIPQLVYLQFVALLATFGFAKVVQFMAEAIELSPDSAEIAQDFRLAPFVRYPIVVVRLVSPSLQTFQVTPEHPQFAPDLLLGRTLIFPRHWMVLLPYGKGTTDIDVG